jgi:glucokinase
MNEAIRVLAGDVGGTNARLAIVEVADGRGTLVARQTVPVAEHDGLEAPLAAFLNDQGDAAPTLGCLGVAGKIDGRRIEGVNAAWVVDADSLQAAGALRRLDLINDFHAAARGVDLLGPDGLLDLGGGEVVAGKNQAILGAGTGLGQALRLPEGGGWRVVGTEGGHRGFAPRDPLQDRLLAWLRAQHGRVSTERVLSGPGLAATYRFLVEGEGRPACAEVEALPEADRPAAITAQAGEDPTCATVLELFVDVYGAEAGNLALTALAEGGVYVAGGIAPRLFTDPDRRAAFRRAFEDKARFADWMRRIPVKVVTDPDLGLLGAAAVAADG